MSDNVRNLEDFFMASLGELVLNEPLNTYGFNKLFLSVVTLHSEDAQDILPSGRRLNSNILREKLVLETSRIKSMCVSFPTISNPRTII